MNRTRVNSRATLQKEFLNRLLKLNKDGILPEQIRYDPASKRYKYRDSGQFLSRSTAQVIQKRYLETLSRDLVGLAARFQRGEIGVALEAGRILKQMHLTQASLSLGGSDRLKSNHLGAVGNILRNQYYRGRDELTGKPYGLKWLAKDAPNLSEKMLEYRLRLFAESTKVTSFKIGEIEAISSGLQYVYRKLSIGHQNCAECIEYARRGIVMVGEIPYPTQVCRCGNNCKCRIYYTNNPYEDIG